MRVEYRVLGPLEVRNGEESLPLAGAKQRALLALLLLHANHVLGRDRLIDELWGERPPDTAVQSVQVYVSRLRKLLPPDTLLTRAPGYLLQVDPEHLDLRCFERLLAEGHEALAAGDAERAARVLHDALELWRGPALAEFAFEPFAQAEIGRLEDLRLTAVEERIEADLALGRHADLIGELEALIGENPQRERLRGQLMLGLYRSGRQAEALEAYQAARHALVDELGIEPSAALQRLEKQILRQDEALDVTARVDLRRADGVRPTPPPPAQLERKLVTVLFADLGLANELDEDPERAGALLDELHSEASAEIEAAGGTVEKGIAGALLATFGAQSARQADHAVRAVSAALATRSRLSEVFGDALTLRISVESGEVILGRPGSFVTGMPVAAAARLIRSTGPGEIVVGERAATAAAGTFQLQARDEAYLLVAPVAPTRSPAQVARRRRRRLLVLVAGTVIAVAAIATLVAFITRDPPIAVPPNSLASIDPATNRVDGHVQVGAAPDTVAVGENAVWVANEDDRTLSRVDPTTQSVHTIALDRATPTGIAVGAGAVWVAHGFVGTVSRVDPQYYGIETIQTQYSRNATTARGSVTIGDKNVWVAFGDASVSRIDPTSRHVVARTYAGNGPTAIAYGLRSVWVANTTDSAVTRINPATNDHYYGDDDTVGLDPSDLTVAFGAVWVADKGEDAISRINPATGSVTQLPAGGHSPTGIAAGFGSLWVANSGDGTVSRVDPQTRKVIATIHVGNSPKRIAVGEGKVWVTVQAPLPPS